MINSCCYSHNSNLKSATKTKEKQPLQNAMQCNAMQTCVSTAILVAAARAAAADQSVNIESRSVPS
jgi:hypothetical protein